MAQPSTLFFILAAFLALAQIILAVPADGIYTIARDDLRLTVRDDKSDRIVLLARDDTTPDSQHWELKTDADGFLTIRNLKTSKFIGTVDRTNNAKGIQKDDPQAWLLVDSLDHPEYYIEVPNTGFVLNRSDADVDPSITVIQDENYTPQTWKFEVVA
ncbi:hypothetical protein BGX26_009391 [Mortierella sp. AD094]|nr:hypothetical protein BGX26_009391 [Mortierella sp. AD094]